MITEQYVVTCAEENFDRPYYSRKSTDSDVYKFYGVSSIGMLEETINEAILACGFWRGYKEGENT